MFADSVAFDSVAPARHRAEVMRAKLQSSESCCSSRWHCPRESRAVCAKAVRSGRLFRQELARRRWAAAQCGESNRAGRPRLSVGRDCGRSRPFDGQEFKEYPVSMAPAEAGLNIRDLTMENPSTLLMLPASGGVVRLRTASSVFILRPRRSRNATALSLCRTQRHPVARRQRRDADALAGRRLITFGAEEHYVVRHMGGRSASPSTATVARGFPAANFSAGIAKGD